MPPFETRMHPADSDPDGVAVTRTPSSLALSIVIANARSIPTIGGIANGASTRSGSTGESAAGSVWLTS